jgi:hypothetical protein
MSDRLGRSTRPILVALVAALALALGGCHGGGGGGGGKKDAGIDGKSCGGGDAGARATNGTTCGCDADCASGFCVDSVCCDSACTGTCKSCNTASAPGLCSLVAAGGAPRIPTDCPASPATSCGLDGTCDGRGSCRSYSIGTVCQPGTCDGVAVSGTLVCDGTGDCTSGPSLICAPFNCDTTTNSCFTTCASDADCAANTKCVAGSCGHRPIGGACTGAGQCASGFCADNICCNSTCSGPCVSCNQSGRLGTCEPTALGAPDPHKVCATTARATCGQTGSCDGIGGCAKYAAETVCLPPTCSGNRVNTAGTCNGLGTCRAQGVQECGTYQCTSGACINHCASDADCVTGHTCVNGSCGPKSLGQPCSAGGECASNFCVDGVCCNSACTGACHSCALSTSLGTCASSPAGGADPHKTCTDQHASACATDGTCDGAGSCHKYPTGTVCAAESCAIGIYTPSSICDANGNCKAPEAFACNPYVCDGTRCFTGCADNSACASGKVCTNSSCGLKPIGAFCSTNAECQSSSCAQGVCCATACAGACQSCAITGTMGQCTAVGAGPDPAGTCTDHGTSTCGTDGKCQSGACERYQQGTACQGAACPASGTTFTPGGTCDGAGTCVVPASSSCFPFGCGISACKATCAADGDCAMPASCISGSCGLKTNGAVCSGGTECKSGVCAQGVCCATACNGTCMSCALSASGAAGTCSPIAAGGADPAGKCSDKGAASCGTTGFCDGNGACALYNAGTQCASASCPSNSVTATLARACDGNGTCKTAATQSCSPFACNAATGTACVAVCAGNSDCAPGNVCNAGACGLKRLGQLCAAGTECGSGNCVDGVCCSAPSCGNCQVCNLTGNAGSCQPVAAGNVEPHGGCAATSLGVCGPNGTCNGNGACALAANGTSCGLATCSGSTDTPVGACDGNGTCAQPTQSCGAYVCGGGVCLTMCAGDGDCIGGDTCQMGSCTHLKPLAASCASNTECLSSFCTDGVCCTSGPCGSCRSCAVSGNVGTCTAVGTIMDPAHVCTDQGATSCGTTGLCDGAGHCADYASGTACAPAGCQASASILNAASTCDGAGNCTPVSTTSCTPYACAAGACNAGCAQPSDCASGYACLPSPDGGPGACVPSG